MRKRCNPDESCRTSGDYISGTYPFDVTDPLDVLSHADAHGGPTARPGYATTKDFACRNPPRRLVLSAQQ